METIPFSATYVTGIARVQGRRVARRSAASQHPALQRRRDHDAERRRAAVGHPARVRRTARESLWPDLQFFAQDKWTFKRVTMNLGLRYDDLTGYAPANDLPANRWMPGAHFERTDVQHWKDFDPRVGVRSICSAPAGRR